MFNWCGQRHVNRPPAMESVCYSRSLYSKHFSPLRHTIRFAVMSKHIIHSCVSHLLRMCGPRCVVWRVAAVIVEPVNAVFCGWAMPDIRKKDAKIIPLRTDRDTTSTIMFVGGTPWVVAPVTHGKPRCMLWCTRHVVGSNCVEPQAVTGSSVSRTEFSRGNYAGVPASTFTKPQIVSALCFANRTYGGKSAKRLASNIFSAWVKCNKIMFSHVDSFLISLVRWRVASTTRTPILTHVGYS